jgi:hypothetical protein
MSARMQIVGEPLGSGLLESMRRENVAQIMRSVRQQAPDRTKPRVGVINSVTLNYSAVADQPLKFHPAAIAAGPTIF